MSPQLKFTGRYIFSELMLHLIYVKFRALTLELLWLGLTSCDVWNPDSWLDAIFYTFSYIFKPTTVQLATVDSVCLITGSRKWYGVHRLRCTATYEHFTRMQCEEWSFFFYIQTFSCVLWCTSLFNLIFPGPRFFFWHPHFCTGQNWQKAAQGQGHS